MRSLYWKIFITFWFASTLIIVTTAWVTSELARQASIPAHEKIFMNSYAHAAVTTFESGHHQALTQWLELVGDSHAITLYLLSNTGEMISNDDPTPVIKNISNQFINDKLNEGLLKFGNVIVSQEIVSKSGKKYRLATISDEPFAHFIQITLVGLSLPLLIAIIISGIICYFLSLYLTEPLRSLSRAANSIATGKLGTRVGKLRGHSRDEIAALSHDFDHMAEKLEKIVQSKERLLQDISHELRSPLARLQIAIELGRKKSDNDAEPEFSRMEEECVRLNSLIGEILDYSRLDSFIYRLKRCKTNMGKLLQQIVDDANFEFKKTQQRVILTIETPCDLYIDEPLIHGAIENILRNALHYSPANQPVLLLMKNNDHKQELIIEIIDHGPGIPNNQLTKVFNPFYRVDNSRTKKTGGYGLGLAIAHQAIDRHNGTIEIHNQKKGGLKVQIKLPIIRVC